MSNSKHSRSPSIASSEPLSHVSKRMRVDDDSDCNAVDMEIWTNYMYVIRWEFPAKVGYSVDDKFKARTYVLSVCANRGCYNDEDVQYDYMTPISKHTAILDFSGYSVFNTSDALFLVLRTHYAYNKPWQQLLEAAVQRGVIAGGGAMSLSKRLKMNIHMYATTTFVDKVSHDVPYPHELALRLSLERYRLYEHMRDWPICASKSDDVWHPDNELNMIFNANSRCFEYITYCNYNGVAKHDEHLLSNLICSCAYCNLFYHKVMEILIKF